MVGCTKNKRLGTHETIVCPYDLGWQVLVGRGMCPRLVQAQSSQFGNIKVNSNAMLLWQEGQQHLLGCAVCFIRDMIKRHVVRVWRCTKVGNKWSLAGAHLVAVPLDDIIEPLAYTSLAENLVHALPPAWM